MRQSLRQLLALAGFAAAVFAVAALGGVATARSVDTWYQSLSRPAWTPPAWVFAPVWTVLYALMAVAAWLVWRRGGWRGAKAALTLFFAQLALNAAWPWLFFALRRPGLAFAELCVLWAAVLATMAAFRPKSLAAAALLLPYFVWITFAAVLNFALWRLNP